MMNYSQIKSQILKQMLELATEFNNDEETKLGDERFSHNKEHLKQFWNLQNSLSEIINNRDYNYLEKANGWKDTVRIIKSLLNKQRRNLI